MSEANARIIIDRLLRESGWVLSGDEGVINVEPELQNKSGVADYVLKDSSDYPLCVIEAKKELVGCASGEPTFRYSLSDSAKDEVSDLTWLHTKDLVTGIEGYKCVTDLARPNITEASDVR
jgi:hypothetical protein